MELSFDDLLAELGMTEARELILLCKRNALPQISRDRPVSKRDANLIVKMLRNKEINWYKYKQRRIDEEERGPVERRIEPSEIEWVASQYKQLLEREAFTPDDANLSIGVAAQGGFLKGGPAEPFHFSIGKGCNILIGERGTGKSTTLTLLGLLSESTTERTGILAEDFVRQMEYTLTSSINMRRIRKALRSLDIQMYALYFYSNGRPVCFLNFTSAGIVGHAPNKFHHAIRPDRLLAKCCTQARQLVPDGVCQRQRTHHEDRHPRIEGPDLARDLNPGDIRGEHHIQDHRIKTLRQEELDDLGSTRRRLDLAGIGQHRL
jgi:hypothetical protein